MYKILFLSLIFSCSHTHPQRDVAATAKENKKMVRLLLTFDDGPSIEPDHSTKTILDELEAQKIKAAFFVLTGPDQFGYHRKSILRANNWQNSKTRGKDFVNIPTVYAKAETPAGFELLKREASDGHVIACHWGGNYVSQFKLHPNRLKESAYDSDGDGKIDRVTEPGNALESDLLQCIARVTQVYDEIGIEYRPQYIRPPLWKYKLSDKLDARPTYRALGLKMILTDAKLFDGGYRWAGFVLDSWLINEVKDAIKSGKKDIILTLHDSNPKTAGDFRYVLSEIRRKMFNFGYKENIDWKFVDNTEDVKEILDSFASP